MSCSLCKSTSHMIRNCNSTDIPLFKQYLYEKKTQFSSIEFFQHLEETYTKNIITSFAGIFELNISRQTVQQLCAAITIKLYYNRDIPTEDLSIDFAEYSQFVFLRNIEYKMPKETAWQKMLSRNAEHILRMRQTNIEHLRTFGPTVEIESEGYFDIIHALDRGEEGIREFFGIGITKNDVYDHIPSIENYYNFEPFTGGSQELEVLIFGRVAPLPNTLVNTPPPEIERDESMRNLLEMRNHFQYQMKLDIIRAIRMGQKSIDRIFGRGIILADIFLHFPEVEDYLMNFTYNTRAESICEITTAFNPEYNSQSECSICYDRISSVKLNCTHEFCGLCTIEYIGRKRKENVTINCPMCRSEVNSLMTSCEEVIYKV